MKEGLKIKIVADNKIPFLKGVLDQVADMVYLPGKEISAADVREADALITRTRTCCDASLLDGSDVKFIATATIGYDHIDTEYCDRQGIIKSLHHHSERVTYKDNVDAGLINNFGKRVIIGGKHGDLAAFSLFV